ncbi:MAG: zf-HC2 domain-containing protein [Gemmataceae bacterium]|nr:zf-HC2 domain-containing protein [Gemmataceae bacterium]
MKCSQVRDDLSGLLYGDLPPETTALLREHLATCEACQSAYESLRRLRQTLSVVPVPRVEVDLALLYRQAAELQERRLRRWRRLAGALLAVAAALTVVAFGLHLEVRVEAHQVVLRWGSPPPPEPSGPRAGARPELESEQRAASPAAEQFQLLNALVPALANDVEARDRRQRQQLASLQVHLQEWQRQTAQRLTVLEQDFAALYAAHLLVAKKGGNP